MIIWEDSHSIIAVALSDGDELPSSSVPYYRRELHDVELFSNGYDAMESEQDQREPNWFIALFFLVSLSFLGLIFVVGYHMGANSH